MPVKNRQPWLAERPFPSRPFYLKPLPTDIGAVDEEDRRVICVFGCSPSEHIQQAMDDFDMLSAPQGSAGNGVGSDEDPAAAFLAQQESEIAGIENDEGFSILDSGDVPSSLSQDQDGGFTRHIIYTTSMVKIKGMFCSLKYER